MSGIIRSSQSSFQCDVQQSSHVLSLSKTTALMLGLFDVCKKDWVQVSAQSFYVSPKLFVYLLINL